MITIVYARGLQLNMERDAKKHLSGDTKRETNPMVILYSNDLMIVRIKTPNT